ncbi:MAG: helix-turn-helix domain-containing protein [Bacteroidales bacterium]|nr:helix-turn-helix domain-containing protein [Bacteroidales bacterium]
MELGFNEIVSLLIIFVSLLLASFLLTSRSANYKSNLLLAFFLIISAQDADAVIMKNFITPLSPALMVFISLTVFFQAPLLYLYILSVINSDFKLKWKHLLHAIPFILLNILLIPRFYSTGFEGQMKYLENLISVPHLEFQISFIVLHVQLLAYIIACFISVNKYRKVLLENFSNASLFNYRWLFQLIFIFAIATFLASLKNLFMFMEIDLAYKYSLLLMSLLLLGYICWMVFRAMRYPELFRGIDSKLQTVSWIAKEDERLVKIEAVQPDPETVKKLTMLNSFMSESEPYLDPSLSIFDLSRQIHIPAKDLSLLINHDLNTHFFDFVNGFRIMKAMEILKDPSKKELTVLEILYEVGFNSKSSFNTAFKKHTRLTPTEYRRKYLLSAA